MIENLSGEWENKAETAGTSYQDILGLKNFLESDKSKFPDEIRLGDKTSNLGYFSQPFRVRYDNKEFILKLYYPVNDASLVSAMIKNHDDYIRELRAVGIRIPETVIFSRKTGKKYQLIIIQEAFSDDELMRNRMIGASEKGLNELCCLIFNDIVKYWKSKPDSLDIGFHPTLRNYSMKNRVLYFFDTFPPMLFRQKELNRMIMIWSPFGRWIKNIVPLKLLNRVSDEYYQLDKMFAGVVGSCCRLRPKYADKILTFSRSYVDDSTLLSDCEKKEIKSLLIKPPRLPGIWKLIRNLSGNTGNPDI
jgi:hypothetical protein